MKAGGAIENKLTCIIEKLADYCDDILAPSKTSFLIAKVKQPEEKKTSGLPPSGSKKQVPLLSNYAQKFGVLTKVDGSDNKSPARKININGPVKVLRDPVKDK